MKKITLLLSMMFVGLWGLHAADLSTGDIAFVAINADEGDDFAIVALADISANDTIYFTDKSPASSTSLTTSEGILTWATGSSIIEAGTIVVFNDVSTSSGVSTFGTLTEEGAFNLAAGGDALFAFLGTSDGNVTVWLAGIQNAEDQSGELASTGLVKGETFINFRNTADPDGGCYDGVRSGEAQFSDYLTIIGDSLNWVCESSNGENILPISTSSFSISTGVQKPVFTNLSPTTGTEFPLGQNIDMSATVTMSDGSVVDSVVLHYGTSADNLVLTQKFNHTVDTFSYNSLYLSQVGSIYGQLVAYAANGEESESSLIELVGVCADVTAPVATDASDIAETSFTANWSDVSADSYLLNVWSEEDGIVALVEEDFTDFIPMNNYTGWTNKGSAKDSYSYHAGVATPARAMGENDTLISPSVNYPVSLSFYHDATDAASGDTASVLYKSDSQLSYILLDTFIVDENGKTEILDLASLSSHSNVTFAFVSSFKTWYLDDVVITGAGVVNVPVVSNEELTTTSYNVTGLTTDTLYKYSVIALDEYACQSEESNIISVTPSAATSLVDLTEAVKVYGVKGAVQVSVSDLQTVTIFDIAGRQVAAEVIKGRGAISLNSGIYLVRIADMVTKIVVQ